MNNPTAEMLALSKKVYATARVLLRKNIEEMRDVKEATTFVAPLVVAAKMFLSKTGLSPEEQKKILLEVVEKVGFAEGGETPMFLG